MKAIKFLLLLFVISSCSTIGRYNSIRLVKANNTETVVLVKEKASDLVLTSEKQENKPLSTIETAQVEIPAENSTDPEIYIENKQNESNVSESDDLEPEIEKKEEDKLIVDQAIRAEKSASASFFLSLAGIITLILPYIGIFPLIIGWILYSRANTSRYITPFGETRLKSSRNILILDTVFLFLWIFLIVLLIFIF